MGIFIAHKTPVEAKQEIEEEDVGGHEVEEPDGAENVTERSFGIGHECWRVADEVTRTDEDKNGQSVKPVVESDGEFPYKNPAQFMRSRNR